MIGVGYERLVNSTELLAGLPVNMLGRFEKPVGQMVADSAEGN